MSAMALRDTVKPIASRAICKQRIRAGLIGVNARRVSQSDSQNKHTPVNVTRLLRKQDANEETG
jgi:hypothetical protein